MIADRGTRVGGSADARIIASVADVLCRELSRWFGHDGCHAVFARVLADTRGEHPALNHIHCRTRTNPCIEGTAEAVSAQGDPATAVALEALLIGVLELVGRLIGDDMANTLIERSRDAANVPVAAPQRRREEA